MKRPVVITSMAMRFLECHGWTLEILEPYVVEGKFTKRGFGVGEEKDGYYILDVGTSIDVDKMYSDGLIGQLIGREDWSELKNMTDLEVLKDRNW